MRKKGLGALQSGSLAALSRNWVVAVLMRHVQRTPAGRKAVKLQGLWNESRLLWADVKKKNKKSRLFVDRLGTGEGLEPQCWFDASTAQAHWQPLPQTLILNPRSSCRHDADGRFFPKEKALKQNGTAGAV